MSKKYSIKLGNNILFSNIYKIIKKIEPTIGLKYTIIIK